MKAIPYGRQEISDEDVSAVVKTLRSDYLTQGPKIEEFERAFAKYVGCQYAVAVANGTAALHLCALALDVGPGQEVITSPITFSASANCIAYCGGRTVFADIDPESYLIDISQVEELLNGPNHGITGMVLVDFAGRPVDLEAFRYLADKHGLWIIEDSCHAPGGFFVDKSDQQQNCGNGRYADLAIFSFHPVKHIAAGEGGMITTNDVALYERLKMLRTHGITKNSDQFKNASQSIGGDDQNYPGWYMEMQSLGYNYRLTDFQAALGLSQLSRASTNIDRRREIASVYWESFQNEPFILGQSGDMDGHAYHLYLIEVENRLGLYNHLREHKIYPQIHYIPVHLMPYYKDLGWRQGDFPVAERYYSRCLSLPMFPSLTDDEQSYVIDKTKQFYA